jgi:hypothetical protein
VVAHLQITAYLVVLVVVGLVVPLELRQVLAVQQHLDKVLLVEVELPPFHHMAVRVVEAHPLLEPLVRTLEQALVEMDWLLLLAGHLLLTVVAVVAVQTLRRHLAAQAEEEILEHHLLALALLELQTQAVAVAVVLVAAQMVVMVRLAALALLLFLTLAHSAIQAAQSHLLVATLSTLSHRLVY